VQNDRNLPTFEKYLLPPISKYELMVVVSFNLRKFKLDFTTLHPSKHKGYHFEKLHMSYFHVLEFSVIHSGVKSTVLVFWEVKLLPWMNVSRIFEEIDLEPLVNRG